MANPLYFIETQTAKLGRWFIECDRDRNSRDVALSAVRNGEALKVLEINEDEGTCRDVTEDLRLECGFDEISFSRADRIANTHDHARKLVQEAV